MRAIRLAYLAVLLLAVVGLFGHPADTNQDMRISQAELTLYAGAYRDGANRSTRRIMTVPSSSGRRASGTGR